MLVTCQKKIDDLAVQYEDVHGYGIDTEIARAIKRCLLVGQFLVVSLHNLINLFQVLPALGAWIGRIPDQI